MCVDRLALIKAGAHSCLTPRRIGTAPSSTPMSCSCLWLPTSGALPPASHKRCELLKPPRTWLAASPSHFARSCSTAVLPRRFATVSESAATQKGEGPNSAMNDERHSLRPCASSTWAPLPPSRYCVIVRPAVGRAAQEGTGPRLCSCADGIQLWRKFQSTPREGSVRAIPEVRETHAAGRGGRAVTSDCQRARVLVAVIAPGRGPLAAVAPSCCF